MKLSAPVACCMGMEPELDDSVEDMRSFDSLARRLANGDPGAPKELVERHHTELYRYARSLLRDGPAAEDAVQAAFERAPVKWPPVAITRAVRPLPTAIRTISAALSQVNIM